MPIEGEIRVRLRWDGRRVRDVALRSTRPTAAARIALGRPPEEAAKLLPTLFAVCGHAQRAAAAVALRAAGARGVGQPSEWTVPLEAVQEIFWRVLIDAPRAISLMPQPVAVATARRVVAQACATLGAARGETHEVLGGAVKVLGELARDHVFGGDGEAWQAGGELAGFDAWRSACPTLPARVLDLLVKTAPGLGRSDVALMPRHLDDGWWSAVVPAVQHDPGFAEAPTWRGKPQETGALSRMQAHPLVAALVARDGCSAATRIAARLVELAVLLGELQRAAGEATPEDERGLSWSGMRTWPLGPGEGLAAVQSARGLLLHHAQLADGRVSSYRIVAPTDWNFHPAGALARGLIGTEADDEATLRARAGLAVQALDPCVGFRIEVSGNA